MRRYRLFGGLAVALVVGLGFGTMQAAEATTLRRMSADDLAARADVVVHGDVIRVGTRMRAEGGRLVPETVVVVRPREMLTAADAPLHDMELVQRGGSYRGGAHIVHGNASFHRGDEVVVFARFHDGALRPVGMSMGAFFADPDVSERPERFSRRTDGARVLDRLFEVAMPEPRMSLAALRACVHREAL